MARTRLTSVGEMIAVPRRLRFCLVVFLVRMALELLGQQAALAEVARLGLLEFGHRRTAGEFGLGLRQDLVQYLHLIVVVGFVLIEGRQRRLRRMP